MATPVGFTVCVASLSVVGSARVFNITLACSGSGGIGANTINAAWVGAISGSSSSPFNAANMDSNWTLTENKATKQLAGGVLEVNTQPTMLTGSATKATPAPNTSVLVHKTTIFGGRRYRGRMSVPPCNIGEGSISRAGVIDSTELPIQQGYWNYVYSYLVSAGVQPYLLHYPTTLPDGGDFPPAPTSIVSLDAVALVGTNGSRLR